MKFLHNDVAYKQITEDIRMLSNLNTKHTYYLSQNAFGRFSIYIKGCSDDEVSILDTKFSDKFGKWFDSAKILDESSFVAGQLERMYKREVCPNFYFVESFLSENSWSGIPSNRAKHRMLKSKIVCFYSFKGGVGRTTTMVMSAIALARQGKRVALIDFDLEAPGVANLLQTKELPSYGVIDFLLESSIYYDEMKATIKIDEYIYTCSSDQLVGNKRGEIYVVPAYGNSSENDLDSYKRKLLRFDLNTPLYNNVETPIDFLLEKVDGFVEPDYIFIDSRSGLHQVGGVTITRYADLVVMLFYGSKQNIAGMKMVLPVVKSNDKDFILVNSQVPSNADLAQKERELFVQGAYDALKLCDLDYAQESIAIDSKDADHFPIDITYNASAAFIDSTEQLIKCYADNRVEFEKLASVIADFLYIEGTEPNSPTFNNAEIIKCIESLTPEVPAAEDEFLTETDLENSFYPMSAYSFIFEPRKFLVLGDKGMGKTALFMVLKHNSYARKLAQFIQSDIKHYQNTSWVVGTDIAKNYKDISSLIAEKKIIRPFWQYLILKSLFDNLDKSFISNIDPKILDLLQIESLFNVIDSFDSNILYLLGESIERINKNLIDKDQSITVIYDALDRIFDEKLRGQFLSELIQIWYDYATVLKAIRSKIFLRNDIFDREVLITDKVKIGNYSANIKWEYDQLFAMVWKRLISKSTEFYKLYKSGIIGEPTNSQSEILGFVPQANEEINRFILTRLMGVKMGSGNKTTTYNWFNNRLSDTRQQIVPRSMLDIFAEAARQENKQKAKTSSNTNVIIRPKSFEDALPKVSSRRVTDMKEEYPKYEKLFSDLKDTVKRSPVEETKFLEALRQAGLEKPEDEIKALIDIGIIRAYKRNLQDVVRYHFPDIYLNGLGLSRTGMK